MRVFACPAHPGLLHTLSIMSTTAKHANGMEHLGRPSKRVRVAKGVEDEEAAPQVQAPVASRPASSQMHRTMHPQPVAPLAVIPPTLNDGSLEFNGEVNLSCP